jgi:hypothetical protein
MSPEQLEACDPAHPRKPEDLDGRSDVYSLGVMMFQLATGRLPFPGANFGEVLIGHLQLAPPQPRSINAQIPEAYEAIVLKCLQKKQEDRFQSMKQLKEAIESCMDSLGISRELPHADDTDIDMQAVDLRPPSYPGARTPGRPTGPMNRNRGTTPNRAQVSRPPGRPQPLARSEPPTQLTPPPQKSRAPLIIGIVLGLAVVAGGGAALLLRGPGNAAVAASRTQPQADPQKPEDAPPVFLSVVAEPLDADVVATWRDGEKRGPAPLSLEVPRNAKVHFEFRKAGYVDYAMDVIADQPQTVKAAMKAEVRPPPPQPPAPVAVEASDRKSRPEKKKKSSKARSPRSSDGVVDVLDDLK